MITIAVGNQKGGVGKTTTAVSLGDWLARMGYLTLIVDTDSQGHVARCLGLEKGDGLLRVLVQGQEVEAAAIPTGRSHLWILPNDHTGELVKVHAAQTAFREFMLAAALERSGTMFDVAILDTPPSTDVLHVATLVAADLLIVPAKMDYLALDGIGGILNAARQLGQFPNVTPPQLVGVLPTLFDRATNETMENVKRLSEALGSEVILPPVAQDTKVREAASYGKTIWEYAPNCAAAMGWKPDGAGAAVSSIGRVGGYWHLGEIVEAMIKGMM